MRLSSMNQSTPQMDDMRINIWKEISLLLAAVICIVLFTFSLLMRPQAAHIEGGNVADNMRENPVAASPEKIVKTEKIVPPVLCEKGSITLKEYDGNVGVYAYDGKLLRTIDVAVEQLPDSDQTELQNGMVIDEADLSFAIESFES